MSFGNNTAPNSGTTHKQPPQSGHSPWSVAKSQVKNMSHDVKPVVQSELEHYSMTTLMRNAGVNTITTLAGSLLSGFLVGMALCPVTDAGLKLRAALFLIPAVITTYGAFFEAHKETEKKTTKAPASNTAPQPR